MEHWIEGYRRSTPWAEGYGKGALAWNGLKPYLPTGNGVVLISWGIILNKMIHCPVDNVVGLALKGILMCSLLLLSWNKENHKKVCMAWNK